jgi:flavin-dependent dehydrogenase
MRSFNAVVVGAGPAGMSAAIGLRAQGLSVLVVDEQPSAWRADLACSGGGGTDDYWRPVGRGVPCRCRARLALSILWREL